MKQQSVFLSHNHIDKPFVRRLAADLRISGVRVWLDEAELNIGDSLFARIGAAIRDVDYLAVVLSNNSVNSTWVQEELSSALAIQFESRKLTVLPIVIESVGDQMPTFLRGRLFADFTDESKYRRSLFLLLRSIGASKSLSETFQEQSNLGRKYVNPKEIDTPDGRRCMQVFERLCVYPELDITDNRLCLLWRHLRDLNPTGHKCSLKIGHRKNNDTYGFHFWDVVAHEGTALELTQLQFNRGVWEYQAPLITSAGIFHFESENGFKCAVDGDDRMSLLPKNTREECPHIPTAKAAVLDALELLRALDTRLSPPAKSYLARFLLVALAGTDREVCLRAGRFKLDQCATFEPTDGRTRGIGCSEWRSPSLFFYVADSFFATENSIWLCERHYLDTMWDAEFDVTRSNYNVQAIGPH